MRGLVGLDIVNCVLKCMLVLYLSFLCWTNKILTVMNLSFVSNFFQSFGCKNLCISTSTSLWPDLSLLFSADLFWLVHGLVQLLLHTANSFHHHFLFIYWCFFTSYPFRRIYVCSTRVDAYLCIFNAFLKHNENKVATFHGLFQTYLILM